MAASLIFRLALSRHFRCFFSEELFEEFSEVLLRRKFQLDAKEVAQSLRSFRASGILVTPRSRIAVARDSDDDKVLECAVEAQADYTVTGNIRDFPQQYRGISVVLPRAFLNILASRAP